MENPSWYTIEEIFGNKANSTIRMYAIKIVSNFFHLIFHFTVEICFLSLLLDCFASIHFFVTYWEKTFDRTRRCVCQVRPFSRCHDGYQLAPAILQKPSRGSVVSRPLTVNQVNSRRFIDWFSCCVQRLLFRSLFFRLKILFYWKIIVVEVTETSLSTGN